MKSETLVAARDIVAGVRVAFSGSGPCRCHTVPKLGEDEVLKSLVNQDILDLADINGVHAITIEALSRASYQGGFGMLTNSAHRALSHRGIRYVTELEAFTFADILAIPNMGRSDVRRVEQVMAEFGLLLKDGDPAFLEAVREDKRKERRVPAPPTNQSPEDIRRTTANALMELGAAMMRDGASLTKNAAKIGFGEGRVAAVIARYITQHDKGATISDEVARIAAPFLALEAAEKNPQRSRANRPAKIDEPVQQIEHLRNVVTGVFAEASSGR